MAVPRTAEPDGAKSRCVAGIDWLGGTFDNVRDGRAEVPLWQVLQDLDQATGGALPADGWDRLEGQGRHGWPIVMQGPRGAELWAGHRCYGMHLELRGEACESIGSAGLVRVAAMFRKASRIDLRIDDYGRRQAPADVWAKLTDDAGRWSPSAGVVTKVKSARSLQDTETGGRTCYVGSPKSDRRLRVYDKRAESGGAIDAIRWELQARGDKAEALRRALVSMAAVDELSTVIGGALRGFIEFRTPRGVRGHAERWRLEDWWSAITAGARTVRVAQPDGRSLAARKIARAGWRARVLPMLEATAEADGIELFVEPVASNARRHFKARHLLIARGVA